MTELAPSDLPGILEDIAEATDVETALALARAVGGTKVFVAARARQDRALARIVGVDAAQKIADRIGAGELKVPAAGQRGVGGEIRRRREIVVAALRAGKSCRAAALEAGVAERTAEKIKARVRLALPLFPDL